MFKKGIKYEIFIGVKDKDTYLETLSIDEVKNILKEECRDKGINFSLLTQVGGYKHHKGYTTETSLRVIIIDVDEKEIISLVDILKRRINTDTIMVAKTEIEYCFSFCDKFINYKKVFLALFMAMSLMVGYITNSQSNAFEDYKTRIY